MGIVHPLAFGVVSTAFPAKQLVSQGTSRPEMLVVQDFSAFGRRTMRSLRRRRTQGRRTRLRRYAACVLCSLRRGAGYASPVLPDRRVVGAQGVRPFAEGPLRLSSPASPETSKPGRVIGVMTLQTQASVLLAGGWQGRRLLPRSEDHKNEKEDAKSHRDAG